MESLEQTRQAPPVARALRILLGLALIAYVAPVYFQIPARISLRVLLLMFGLLGAYSLIHILISRRIISFGPCVGAIVAGGFLVLLFTVRPAGTSTLHPAPRGVAASNIHVRSFG